MALTQIQIIQSLGEAMTWFERERAWGVPATELRHLTGRIGELYAALITNGQMATEVNQKGYDVVSGTGERISVKTTARLSGSGPISFNPNTLDLVDRVMVFRLNEEKMEIETLLDTSRDEVRSILSWTDENKKCYLQLNKLLNPETKEVLRELQVIKEVNYQNYQIKELENGTIQVFCDGKLEPVTKPVLRKIAKDIAVSSINSQGNPYNTRQLGSLVVNQILSDMSSD